MSVQLVVGSADGLYWGTSMSSKRDSSKRKTTKRKTTKRKSANLKMVKRKTSTRKKASASTKRWSKGVMEHSDAMDLKAGVFKLKSGTAIAHSLKRSSEASSRRKSSPFQSAMSMLNFEINRAGKNLSQERRSALNQAKVELRKAFGRPV